MGFALHGRTFDAPTPAHPYLATYDGYAWHDDPERQTCFNGGFLVGEVPAELVSKALMGAPVDRLIALLELSRASRAAFERMFARECIGCGRNHLREARHLLWAARMIAPAAVNALRAANIPLLALTHPRLPPGPREHGGRPRKSHEPRWRGLPVGKNVEESALRQIAYAAEMKSRSAFSPAELARFARMARRWAAGDPPRRDGARLGEPI